MRKILKQSERNKISEVLFAVAMGLMIFIILSQLVLFIDALISSYKSYRMDCPQTAEDKQIDSNEWAGRYDSSTDTIYINPEYSDETTIIHERCHRVQKYQNREYACSNPIGVFINELECNLMENR